MIAPQTGKVPCLQSDIPLCFMPHCARGDELSVFNKVGQRRI